MVRAGLLIALGIILGVAAGAAKWRGSAEYFHQEARLAAILAKAQQVPPGGILVIGDSVTERVWMPMLCRKPVLNAGIAWATSRDLLPYAREMVRVARPSMVAIELPVNDRGRYSEERRELARIATFTVAPPTSTVDGVHPDPRGATQFRQEIEMGCRRASSGVGRN
jgi:hypothetical protein